MDINVFNAAGSAGTTFIDNYRMGGGIDASGTNAAGEMSGFADTLKKTAAAQAAAAPESQTRSNTVTIDKTDKLYEQCLELEIFMVKNLLNSMRSTVQKSGLVNEGFAGKMYEDMLYDEYAEELTKNAGFGMADLAYLELSKQRNKGTGLVQ